MNLKINNINVSKGINLNTVSATKFFTILALSATVVFASTASQAADEEFKHLRIFTVDASDYSNEYESAEKNDPIESVNRGVYTFNDYVDEFALSPLAKGYDYAVPEWGQSRVGDFFNNLAEPVNYVNSLFQGDVGGMFTSFWRFVINSTIGIAGFHDVAAGFGLEQKDKSFTQTLAVYGVPSGPYIVLPVMGPSTPRDFVAGAADRFARIDTYLDGGASAAFSGVEVVNKRNKLAGIIDDVKENSFDPYSSVKSIYLQKTKNDVLKTIE